MKSYLNCKRIDTAIARAKKMLIERAAKDGIYENFGRAEVGEIEDKFIDISDYTDSMNWKREELRFFSDWCATYNGKQK